MQVLTKSVEECVIKADFRVGAARELPIVDRPSWDGTQAKRNIFSFADFDTDNPKPAKAKRAFLIFDSENPDLKGSYKLPFADVVDGKLVAIAPGLRAAASRLPQTDVPDAVKNRARRVLDSYFERMDESSDKNMSDEDFAIWWKLSQPGETKSEHRQVFKLAFDTDVFDVESAMSWASAHGFRVPESAPEEKVGEIIIFQRRENEFVKNSFRKKRLSEGVVAIDGETIEDVKNMILNFVIKSTVEKKDDGPHTFTAFATTFGNIDRHDDVISPAAVQSAVKRLNDEGKMPKILKDHDSRQRPAVMTSMVPNDKGLVIEGKFLETQLGKDTFIEVRDGAITDMSIGFMILSDHREDEIRVIDDMELMEVSFVTFPANEHANIISVKNSTPYPKPDTIRQFEKLLRDAAGFSKKEATTIASVGFGESKARDVLMQSIVENLKDINTEMRIKHVTNSDIREHS